MSKLDDLIRERGCDTLTALAWCQENGAIVGFSPDEITVEVEDCNVYCGKTLPEAVVACVKNKA